MKRERTGLIRAVMIGVALLGAAAGCATIDLWTPSEKTVIRSILGSSVQIVLERSGARFRTGSGVVIATLADRTGTDCLVLTSGHTFAGVREADDSELFVLLDRHLGAGTRARARLLAHRETEEVDLALLRVRVSQCSPVLFGRPPGLGDRIWIVGFPWGRQVRLISGIVSQVTLDDGGRPRPGATLMVDASVAYGMSGGGVFEARTGRLVGLTQGYGTARLPLGEKPALQYIDVPVPGETYVTSLDTIERFLQETGQGNPAGLRGS